MKQTGLVVVRYFYGHFAMNLIRLEKGLCGKRVLMAT